MVNRRPQLRMVAPSASAQEAVAVVAALERFMRDTAPGPPQEEPRSAWQRAALREAVDRHSDDAGWGDPPGGTLRPSSRAATR